MVLAAGGSGRTLQRPALDAGLGAVTGTCRAGASRSADGPAETKKETSVPYVNIQITAGVTREEKAALVKDATDSLVRALGKQPEHIHVVIQEIEEENWGFSGLLTDDWKRRQGGSSSAG